MDKQTQKDLLEIVRKNYDDIAAEFSETRKKFLWPELIKLAEAVKDSDKILDVGCGSGRLLEAFKGKNIRYIGVDQSEKLLALAKNNYPKQTFAPGNLLELSRQPEINFDHVFCIAVLHHLPGKELRLAALRQLKNKISETGRIIITVWNLWGIKKFRNLIIKFILLKLVKKNRMDKGDIVFDWKNSAGEIISQRYYHAFHKRELKKLAKTAGLRIERIYKDKYNYYLIFKK